MAIIDLVSWSPQGRETIYAHKFPETNLSTYTQLIVQESQEAVLFSKGQIISTSSVSAIIYSDNVSNPPHLYQPQESQEMNLPLDT